MDMSEPYKSMSLIKSRFSAFAEKRIAPRADSLSQSDSIPDDLWTAMGANGLFGLGLPPEAGGQGYDARSISEAGRVLVESGGNLGIAMSWLIHEIISRCIVQRFGAPEQHRDWLPALAAGRITGCFAVSEPGAGAHPKHLKTRAVRENDHYRITGEKTYLTNGPIAGLFIVIAITKEDAGRKGYTAFIIPNDAPGLTVKSIPLNFLKPSPHGRILLEDCRVPAGQILGPIDGAYEAMVLPFREIEDILMMGPVLGGMAFLGHQMRNLAAGDEATKSLLFDAHIATSGLRIIAQDAADLLEKGSDPELRTELVLFFRKHAAELVAQLESIGGADFATNPMAVDLAALQRIRGNVVDILKKKRQAEWWGAGG